MISRFQFRSSPLRRCLGGVFALVVTGLLQVLPSCHAGVIMNSTGAGLLGDSRVTFPNGTPQVQNDSLILSASSSGRLKLLQVSIGTLAPGQFVEVEYRHTRLTGDSDPSLLITDGQYLAGGQMADNIPGFFLSRWQDGGTTLGFIDSEQATTDPLYPQVGGSATFSVRVAFTANSNTVSAWFSPSRVITQHIPSLFLDPSRGLALVIGRDNESTEAYQLDFLRIRTGFSDPAAVPEPATLPLLLCGMASWLVCRRQHRRLRSGGTAPTRRSLPGSR